MSRTKVKVALFTLAMLILLVSLWINSSSHRPDHADAGQSRVPTKPQVRDPEVPGDATPTQPRSSTSVPRPVVVEPVAPRWSLVGTVVSASRLQPIGGVRLEVYGSEVIGSSVSDDDGQFELQGSGNSAGLTLGASAKGYLARTVTIANVSAGDATDVGRIVLVESAEILARVARPEGTPVAGAAINHWQVSVSSVPSAAETRDSLRTDANGELLIRELPAGDYFVTARTDDGAGTLPRRVRLTVGERARADLVVSYGATLAVRVLAASGETVKGARIALCPTARNPDDEVACWIGDSDSNGMLRVDHVPPGSISAWWKSGSTWIKVSDTRSASERELTVVIPAMGKVWLEVCEDDSDVRMPGVDIEVRSGLAVARSTTDEHGRVDVAVPMGGLVETVIVRAPRCAEFVWHPSREQISLMASEAPAVPTVVRVQSGRLITGVARSGSGAGVGALLVRASWYGSEGSIVRQCVSDAEGRFRLEGVGTSAIAMDVVSPRFVVVEQAHDREHQLPPRAAFVSIPPGTEAVGDVTLLVVERSAQSLVGRVVDERGEPVSDAAIAYFDQASITVSDGSFEVSGFAPKAGEVVGAWKLGHVSGVATIPEGGGSRSNPVVIVAPRGGRGRIRFVTSNGSAVPGALVQVAAAFRTWIPWAQIPAMAADGQGECSVIVPGGGSSFWLRVSAPGCNSYTERRDLVEGAVDVVMLSPSRRLEGHVRDNRGKAVPGARVMLCSVDAASTEDEFWRSVAGTTSAISDVSGAFEFTEVPGEDVWVGVRHPQYREQLRRVTLAPECEFILEEGFSLSGRCQFDDGVPLMGAAVVVYSDGKRSSTITDSSGSFQVDGLSAGPHQLHVLSILVPPVCIPLIKRVGIGENAVVCILTRPKSIHGAVVTTSGAPLPKVSLMARCTDRGSTELTSAQTDVNGRFSFDGLSGSQYRVEVRSVGETHAAFGRVLGPGKTRPATLESVRSGASDVKLVCDVGSGIRIRVLSGRGSPAAGVPIYCVRGSTSSSVLTGGVTDSTGRLTIVGLESVSYRLGRLLSKDRFADFPESPILARTEPSEVILQVD